MENAEHFLQICDPRTVDGAADPGPGSGGSVEHNGHASEDGKAQSDAGSLSPRPLVMDEPEDNPDDPDEPSDMINSLTKVINHICYFSHLQ